LKNQEAINLRRQEVNKSTNGPSVGQHQAQNLPPEGLSHHNNHNSSQIQPPTSAPLSLGNNQLPGGGRAIGNPGPDMRSSARDDHNAFAFGDTNRLMEEKAVGNLPLNVELERASSSHSSTPPPTWFYRDPTGVIQGNLIVIPTSSQLPATKSFDCPSGPFSNQDMFEWNERGFFRDHLHVKRSIDDDFVVLGELRKKLGANPFIHQVCAS
jgi:hypothetical protein